MVSMELSEAQHCSLVKNTGGLSSFGYSAGTNASFEGISTPCFSDAWFAMFVAKWAAGMSQYTEGLVCLTQQRVKGEGVVVVRQRCDSIRD
jgi:hypothetical protein